MPDEERVNVKILAVGDVVGDPGRKVLEKLVPQMKRSGEVDFVIANGENAAGGAGLTPSVAREMLDFGIDVITSGDHIWKYNEIYDWMDENPQVIRPLNYPNGAPGEGSTIVRSQGGIDVGVVNALGRVFLSTVDCPFRSLQEEVEKLRSKVKIIVVDFHAEATSEKMAMGYYLDGKVSGVVGTHTHIQTADERILPKGTAYLTDLGMVGPYESVIGREVEAVLKGFLNQRPMRYPVAKNRIRMCGAIIEVDEATGRATKIERVNKGLEGQ